MVVGLFQVCAGCSPTMVTTLVCFSAAFAALLVFCWDSHKLLNFNLTVISRNQIFATFFNWDDFANKELPTPGTGCSVAPQA